MSMPTRTMMWTLKMMGILRFDQVAGGRILDSCINSNAEVVECGCGNGR